MEFKFKIILLGPGAVGKTSLLHRFVLNQFSTSYQMTMGVDFLKKEITVQNNSINLTIWDVAGQERFKFMRKNYYRGAQGALLIFDLTREDTLNKLMNKWYSEMVQFLSKDIPFLLVGNKSDLIKEIGSVVDSNLAKNFAKSKNSVYIETSAKSGENVEDAFMELSRRITSTANSDLNQ
ncbi:MAG: GTP-binding protein [Promethearchaeota archaeon]|nr:MAG: GTP-binding protein [Candidatus Lokiarchaeota archaeon]